MDNRTSCTALIERGKIEKSNFRTFCQMLMHKLLENPIPFAMYDFHLMQAAGNRPVQILSEFIHRLFAPFPPQIERWPDRQVSIRVIGGRTGSFRFLLLCRFWLNGLFFLLRTDFHHVGQKRLMFTRNFRYISYIYTFPLDYDISFHTGSVRILILRSKWWNLMII